jgi:hypothetical protein
VAAKVQAEISLKTMTACARYSSADLVPAPSEPPEVRYSLALYRGLRLARLGRHAEAATIADKLRRVTDVHESRAHAAWVMAACAGAVRRATPAPSDAEALWQRYRDTCLEDMKAFAEQCPALFPRGGYEPDTQELYTDPVFQKGLSEIGRRLDVPDRHNEGHAIAH